MTSDYLCEKRLAELSPEYHRRIKDTVVSVSYALEKYRNFFPDYTDHTVLHSMQVLDFCNRLIGEQVTRLNEDELYILIMSAYLHDCGMGISEADYKELADRVISEEYRRLHPDGDIRETIRRFHQSFSRQFIYKYAPLFEFPSDIHTRAIALVSEGHREVDLFDESVLPSVLTAPNGNPIRLPYLAALIRLADELDVAADRNIGFEADEKDTIFRMMHRSVRHLRILPDRFVLDVAQDDPALFCALEKEAMKLRETVRVCREVTALRTPFSITQADVEICRVKTEERHAIVLDTDMGTDDACALLVLKCLPVKPDYVVACFGNTSLDGACRNAMVLRKYLGLGYRVARGKDASDDPNLPLAEKNDFHGPDGLAGRAAAIAEACGADPSLQPDLPTFDAFRKELLTYDAITYITIGTLSGLASLLGDPAFRRKLRGAYVMGGGIDEWNCSHRTEFNFSKDPAAVRTILSSGLNITLFPLDLTNRQRLTSAQIDRLEKTGRYPEFIRLLRHNLRANSDLNGIPAAVLHDVMPVLYQSHPDWFTLREMRVVSDEYGRTIPSGAGEALHVCTALAEGRLFALLCEVFGCPEEA